MYLPGLDIRDPKPLSVDERVELLARFDTPGSMLMEQHVTAIVHDWLAAQRARGELVATSSPASSVEPRYPSVQLGAIVVGTERRSYGSNGYCFEVKFYLETELGVSSSEREAHASANGVAPAYFAIPFRSAGDAKLFAVEDRYMINLRPRPENPHAL